MNVLITGGTGFLNKYLKCNSNHSYITVGRHDANIKCDLSEDIPYVTQVDLVVHAAGKAHSIPRTFAEKRLFFDVNVTGTKNLLLALERAPQAPKYFVFISSVAVYGLDSGILIKEDSPLLAKDPYGKSKIEAERVVREWCKKNNVICTVLRLPLLAGTNPPGNLGAMIKGIKKGYYFNIGGGKARKSIVLAEDVASVIPIAAAIGGTYNLTDRYHPNFYELSDSIAKQLGSSKPVSIPMLAAKAAACIGNLLGNSAPINSRKLRKITSDLTFDDSKAVEAFGWNPTLVLQGFKIK